MTALRRARDEFDEGNASPGLSRELGRAAAVLSACLPPHSPLLSGLASLRERLIEERLQLAVLGQFKRGKSTFLNALLGAPLLPSAVIPVTAIPTFIAWGQWPLARISFAGGRAPEECKASDPKAIRDFLFGFVAEDSNPRNFLGVARAELFYPAPILAGGTVLIDTPGIASTLKHNTEAALHVLPECDAALFIVATDPPITAAELDYLEQIKVKTSRIFIVVNKIDYVGAEEQESIITFLRKVLDERALHPAALFQVSSRDGLAAKIGSDREKLNESGITEIEEHLLNYLATEKIRTLAHAIRLKASDILAQAGTEIELRMQALKMPLEDLEAKTVAFEDALQEIERLRRITRDLLSGDKRRLTEALEERAAELRDRARLRLAGVIDDSLGHADPTRWEERAQTGLAEAIEDTFETARTEVTRECSAEADAVLAGYQQRIDELVATVRRTAANLFDIPFRQDIESDRFELGEDPYWVTERISASLIPDPGRMVDRVLPATLRRARMRARLLNDAEVLIIRNTENLRWAILRGFEETFRNALDHLEQRLDDAIGATKRVIGQALADRRDQSFAVDPDVERLRKTLASLEELRARLSPEQGG